MPSALGSQRSCAVFFSPPYPSDNVATACWTYQILCIMECIVAIHRLSNFSFVPPKNSIWIDKFNNSMVRWLLPFCPTGRYKRYFSLFIGRLVSLEMIWLIFHVFTVIVQCVSLSARARATLRCVCVGVLDGIRIDCVISLCKPF